MDLGTLIGILSGFAIILTAILIGSDIGIFFNIPSILIVFGGTIAATLIKFPLSDVMTSFKTGVRIAFKNVENDPQALVDKAIEVAGVVRKNGLVALQSVKVNNDVFQRGLMLCADGHAADVVRETIERESNMLIMRQEKGELMFRGIGETAPAFGMLGTLVGLIQMLSNMNDPATIGPAMAIAMLTTFYGALVANLVAIPIADKLAQKTEKDKVNLELILDSLVQIHGSQNPTVLAEMLKAYLPVGGGGKGKKAGKGGAKAAAADAKKA